jgi:hypothetical protein
VLRKAATPWIDDGCSGILDESRQGAGRRRASEASHLSIPAGSEAVASHRCRSACLRSASAEHRPHLQRSTGLQARGGRATTVVRLFLRPSLPGAQLMQRRRSGCLVHRWCGLPGGAQKPGPSSDSPVSLDPDCGSGGRIRTCSGWMTMMRRSVVSRGGRQRRESQHDDQRSCGGGGGG